MASAEREAIMGLGVLPPPLSGVQGKSPWSWGQGASPHEAESFLAFARTKQKQIYPILADSWQMTNYSYKGADIVGMSVHRVGMGSSAPNEPT